MKVGAFAAAFVGAFHWLLVGAIAFVACIKSQDEWSKIPPESVAAQKSFVLEVLVALAVGGALNGLLGAAVCNANNWDPEDDPAKGTTQYIGIGLGLVNAGILAMTSLPPGIEMRMPLLYTFAILAPGGCTRGVLPIAMRLGR